VIKVLRYKPEGHWFDPCAFINTTTEKGSGRLGTNKFVRKKSGAVHTQNETTSAENRYNNGGTDADRSNVQMDADMVSQGVTSKSTI
jgi:hypothetical protein